MKKKIKDLTVNEIKKVCKSVKLKNCTTKKCPFYEHQWLCLGLKNMSKKEMETEVEVDE